MACTHPQRLGNMCACCGAPAALGGAEVSAAEFCALVHLWDTLKLDMPDFSVDEAVGRVQASVGSLGDSATGLLTDRKSVV